MIAAALEQVTSLGEGERTLHSQLARFNRQRLTPQMGEGDWHAQLRDEYELRQCENEFIEGERQNVMDQAAQAPTTADGFASWFENLGQNGPGTKDPLFPWLSEHATLSHFRWFLSQEMASESGFDDLVALSQVKAPARAKLEMARNYWDELGHGDQRSMHSELLHRVTVELGLAGSLDSTVWEALALGNLMVGLAANRRYAYHSLGALGIVELTAPTRVSLIDQGLRRIGINARSRRYFTVRTTLDVHHARAWITEVIHPLVATEPRAARSLAEGALMWLAGSARCYARYRRELSARGAEAI
jgi:hypothetical protein